MADRKDVGEEWNWPSVILITEQIVDCILDSAMETVLLEDAFAEMEVNIKRNILEEDKEEDDPTPEAYRLYHLTGGFSVPPPHYPQSELQPSKSSQGQSLLRNFDPVAMSVSSGGSRGTRRSERSKKRKGKSCSFCERNGERSAVFLSHQLKEGEKVTCPQLRSLVCQLCGATADQEWLHILLKIHIFL